MPLYSSLFSSRLSSLASITSGLASLARTPKPSTSTSPRRSAAFRSFFSPPVLAPRTTPLHKSAARLLSEPSLSLPFAFSSSSASSASEHLRRLPPTRAHGSRGYGARHHRRPPPTARREGMVRRFERYEERLERHERRVSKTGEYEELDDDARSELEKAHEASIFDEEAFSSRPPPPSSSYSSSPSSDRDSLFDQESLDDALSSISTTPPPRLVCF
ncbi:hypothetical protein JCM8547_009262 [Rhodosporidiobolus lusitaniae]